MLQSESGVCKERCGVHIRYTQEKMAHSQESYVATKQDTHRQHGFSLCNSAQEEWNDKDDNYDIQVGAHVGGNVMDPRVVNLRYGPADRSYVCVCVEI